MGGGGGPSPHIPSGHHTLRQENLSYGVAHGSTYGVVGENVDSDELKGWSTHGCMGGGVGMGEGMVMVRGLRQSRSLV